MQCNSKAKLLVFLVLVALIVLPFTAFAEGDGSGGGQNQPLALLASTPADGAQNVALDTKIKLSFNKNVVNMSVASNNRKCFTITQGQNNVAFDVVMADDQVQPEGKRDIVLVPRSSLLPGTSYRVIISSGLLAKNGSTMVQDITITFTTAGAAPKAPAANEATLPQVKESAPNAVETQPEASSNNTSLTPAVDAAQKDVSQAASESTAQENRATTGRTVKCLTYAGIIVLLGAGGVIFYRRKRK